MLNKGSIFKFLRLTGGILFMLISSSLLKIFLIDNYYIPSDSMNPTLKSGDYMLVNKLSYGSRWPQSPLDISWFNLLALSEFLRPWFVETEWGYNRWPNGDRISRNEVVVFEGTWSPKTVLVKRCKGLPGEKINLIEDKLFIDGVEDIPCDLISYHYNQFASDSIWRHQKERFDIPKMFFSLNTKATYYSLHPSVASQINDRLDTVALKVAPFPGLNTNDYQTVLVPAKGLTINLYNYLENIEPYKKAMEMTEGASLKVSGGNLWINGELDSLFTFQNNYYFMMGDNRHESQDSRVWGFVPEQNIIGRARWTWFSIELEDGDIRWDRIFKSIR